MGWISKRHMTQGGTIGRPPKKGDKILQAPLRKIVNGGYSNNMFSPPAVLLECGHIAYSFGQYRARCLKCLTKEREG